jgi:hypothetical protein
VKHIIFLLQGLFFLLLFFTGLYSVRRENIKAHAYAALENSHFDLLGKYVELWRKIEPVSSEMLYLSARYQFENFLNNGGSKNLDAANELYARAVESHDRDPVIYYHWALLQLTKARVFRNADAYLLFRSLMREACLRDPNNYYYYSIFFENLLSLLDDISYRRLRLSHQDLLQDISFALTNYLRLHDWYRERYLAQLEFYFTKEEQESILAGK